jgi:dipeptidyl aminopeptidase/acylaminoacyl peptidase
MTRALAAFALALALASGAAAAADAPRVLQPMDVFALEYASDPQISPDGSRVVYVRSFMDVMKDRRRSNLWSVGADGTKHRPLTSGNRNDVSPRWSPSGDRIAWVSSDGGTPQVHVRYTDTGEAAVISRLAEAPQGLAWSPDGRQLAFFMHVPDPVKPFVEPPVRPEGAEWAAPPKVVTRLVYRADGEGYLRDGHSQLFVLSAEGGAPRQLTDGPFDHDGQAAWTPDGAFILLSANRHDDGEYDPANSEVYEVAVADGTVRALTSRSGPDGSPAVSPDGRRVAYLGYDDRLQFYQVTRLYVMNRDGSEPRCLTDALDRDVSSPVWARDGKGLYVEYDDQGTTRVALVSLEGSVTRLAEGLGGTSLDRPYSGGSFSVSSNGRIAFTLASPDRPAEVAVVGKDAPGATRLTRLNEDLLGHRALGRVEEMRWKSSKDGRAIEGWVVTPPGFDPSRKYPLVLEIHGGPVANYGPRFAFELQLFAAAGYVVLYANPRGSDSYGAEFGNLIHHDYPGDDYFDLMSGVDAAIARGFVDERNLFVTGGSGGGVLTAWIVGKTDRFRAAVAAKPVINWYSFVLTADMTNFFYKYWFSGFPWDHEAEYMRRSPLSLVGQVKTPTMVMTGEADFRTPISESEQYYQALKLRRVDTALVRVPGASHDIAARPSQLIAKAAHILAWFEKYRLRDR